MDPRGDRNLNHAIHMVAITQVRNDRAGRALYLRKQAEGKIPKEALRALKRRISDVVYRQLLETLPLGGARVGKWGRLLDQRRPNPNGRLFGEATARTPPENYAFSRLRLTEGAFLISARRRWWGR